MVKQKLCQCTEDCDHLIFYSLTIKELELLYDYLKHQYISYDNADLINLVQAMSRELKPCHHG